MISSGKISWFVKPSFDAPALRSPQPCIHGAGCNYTIVVDGVQKPGCCGYVHPGEEGTGRRYFPARTIRAENGNEIHQPACVRLTGNAGFYERRRKGLSWGEWCLQEGIPYYPHGLRERHAPITIVPITRQLQQPPRVSQRQEEGRKREMILDALADALAAGGVGSASKKEIGDQLFPLVKAEHSEQAEKIMDVLFESLNEAQLLEMIKSPAARTHGIRVAVDVLYAKPAPPPPLNIRGGDVDWVAAFGLNRCRICEVDSGDVMQCPNGCYSTNAEAPPTPRPTAPRPTEPPPVIRVRPNVKISEMTPRELDFSASE